MSTQIVWTDESKPSGLDEVEITDNWAVIVDGRAQVANSQYYARRDGGVTFVLTIRIPADPPNGATP